MKKVHSIPIAPQTQKYASPDLPWQEDTDKLYIPDMVLDALFDAARSQTKTAFAAHLAKANDLPDINQHRILIPEPRLSLQESMELVARAFDAFDSQLAAKARAILADPTRWNFNAVSPGEGGGGGNSPDPKNGRPRMVIRYSYDGTINDAVYIAHELGHALASDFALEAGRTKYAVQKHYYHLMEPQGFFTQHILYDYLLSQNQNPELKIAAEKHYITEVTRSLYSWPRLLTANQDMHLQMAAKKMDEAGIAAILEEWFGKDYKHLDGAAYYAQDFSDPDMRKEWTQYLHAGHPTAAIVATGFFRAAKQDERMRQGIISALLGDGSDILKVLKAAGVETEASLKKWTKVAVAETIKPLQKTIPAVVPKPSAKALRTLQP